MKKLLIIIICIPLFLSECYAEQEVSKAAEIIGIEKIYDTLPENVEKISGKIDADGQYDSVGALERLWRSTIEKLENEVQSNIESFFSLVLLNLLCAICANLCQEKKIAGYINAAGVCAVADPSLSNKQTSSANFPNQRPESRGPRDGAALESWRGRGNRKTTKAPGQ